MCPWTARPRSTPARWCASVCGPSPRRPRSAVRRPPSAGLSAERPVPFAEAAGHPPVMPASGHALRRLIDAAAVRAGAARDIGAQTNSMRVRKQFVPTGHGWTVLPGAGIAEDIAVLAEPAARTAGRRGLTSLVETALGVEHAHDDRAGRGGAGRRHRHARRLGLTGELCVRPYRLPYRSEGFAPTVEELRRARAVLDVGDPGCR
ncbi:LysR substrate-binding domain-containing protein [Streptomyces sp. NPDC057474]|uniref:LysR substrate-binding domain-containing protein n=1 Tax=Streptomyces sp. NPDC057474 TaxID=3346144 RepID=UPI00368CA6EB